MKIKIEEDGATDAEIQEALKHLKSAWVDTFLQSPTPQVMARREAIFRKMERYKQGYLRA